MPFEPVRAHHLIDREAHDHPHRVADRLLGLLDQLAEQAQTVLQAAAIVVRAVVVAAGEEMAGHGAVVAGIDDDRIEAHGARPQRRAAVPAAIGPDVGKVHGARLDRMAQPGDRPVRRTDGHLAAVEIAAVLAVVHQLDAGEAAVAVDGFGHAPQIGLIALVPQVRLGEGLGIAGHMEIALLGAHHAPSAFRLHAAHGDHGVGEHPPHAVAVGGLIEAVGRRHRADGNGFEQDVIAGIAHVGCRPLLVAVGAGTADRRVRQMGNGRHIDPPRAGRQVGTVRFELPCLSQRRALT